MSTIYALSSGLLPSAIAIVRVSGPQTKEILLTLINKIPPARYMYYGPIIAKNGELLDNALTVFFDKKQSFTGEDSAEFHLHGGKAVVSRFLQELSKFEDVRLATAGEFSKRAFLHGKFDLIQAEGLADLIHAESESQRQLALREAEGSLSTKYSEWRKALIKIRALIEAELDFSDQEDITEGLADNIYQLVASLKQTIEEDIRLSNNASILRDGFKIVLIGSPNSGKSSLINKLAGRKIAIISEEAGTTRDAIETQLILDGHKIFITDTAGIREANNQIEKFGIEITFEKMQDADLILYIEDINNYESNILPPVNTPVWKIGNKKDISKSTNYDRWDYIISALTGENIDLIVNDLRKFVADKISEIGNFIPARERHLIILNKVVEQLTIILSEKDIELEIKSEYLRHASVLLGQLTGDVDVEDLLDVIFSEFCIGK